ncbi:MAG: TIGR01212 family radical SAM protein [Oscillospiraceae bacterium]|nr:TIGR01212 family radical SAM protein [Oscillospiraceae bacterium]
MNPFPYALDNKRYHTLHYHNLQVFGGRVEKAVLNGGFTCPNIDGTKGTGGCAFCDGGSGAFTHPAPLAEQLRLEMARIHKKRPEARAITYFQVHTNTYAPLPRLRELYEEALACPGICGLSVGTRPDCLPEDVLDYLAEIAARTYLTVELGVQTIHDRTAADFGRGYAYADFLGSYHRLQARGIRTCLHIINGLPGENHADMLETARVLGQLRPQAMKIQLLHILKGTRYAERFERGEIRPMTQDDYIRTVAEQLSYLPPETVVERVTGDGEKAKLLAPLWSMDKIRTLGGIDKCQREMDSWQGKNLTSYSIPVRKI